jgi:hypothetical protein
MFSLASFPSERRHAPQRSSPTVPASHARISIIEQSYPPVYNAAANNDLQANLMNRFMIQFELV